MSSDARDTSQNPQDSLVYSSLISSLPDDIILKLSIQNLQKLFTALKASPIQVSQIKTRRRLLQSRQHTIKSRAKAREEVATLNKEKESLLTEKGELKDEVIKYKQELSLNQLV